MLALFRSFLTKNAMESGIFIWLYRKNCSPMCKEWVQYLKHHNVQYQIGNECSVQMNVTITDPKHVRPSNKQKGIKSLLKAC